jgi:hypothetical protein
MQFQQKYKKDASAGSWRTIGRGVKQSGSENRAKYQVNIQSEGLQLKAPSIGDGCFERNFYQTHLWPQWERANR